MRRARAIVLLTAIAACAHEPAAPAAPVVVSVPGGSPDFAAVARRVLPSVVSIEAMTDVRRSAGLSAHRDLRFAADTPAEPEVSEGSGFVIDAKGLILTNNHVVEGVDVVAVTLTSDTHAERTLLAKVIGTAPDYDVALLETQEDAKATPIAFADSDALPVGAWVMAVGNPFGLAESVTVGIVSAKGRRDLAPSGRPGIYDFLQTDAAVNPGNSGGPLIDMEGRVVGMNTAINAEGVGLSFAIPSNMLTALVQELRASGSVKRGHLGLTLQPLTSDLASSFGMSEARGALVCAIDAGGPAAKGGLREGDIVVRFGEREVERSSDIPIWVGTTRPGTKVKLGVWRDGKQRDLEVVVAEASGAYELHYEPLGLTLQPVMPDLQDDLQLDSLRGAYVAAVDRDSDAERAGFMADDVILRVGSRDVKSVEDLIATLDKTKARSVVRFLVVRKGGRVFIGWRR